MAKSSTSVAPAWSEGTGPNSARFAKGTTEEHHGVPATQTQLPYAGMSFMKSMPYTLDKLSLNDLPTDREWSAARASCVLIKGSINVDQAKEALKDETNLHPVLCKIDGETKALATIWINELYDSVCGAYHEYVISVDVTSKSEGVVAFEKSKKAAAYACWYNNFGSDKCEAQFLHSLYINSILSITWGREMQAFPKHPEPVDSDIAIRSKVKTSQFGWTQDAPLFRVATTCVFGLVGFLKEAWGLITSVGLFKVCRFLVHSSFRTHIYMPQATAQQQKRPREFTATLWKGLAPAAVKLWPWNPETDQLELGGEVKPTGAEVGNGAPWLKETAFEPLGVCFVEKLSALVQVRKTTKE